MHYHARLRALEPAANCYREYQIEARPSEHGGFVLVTHRGRIGQRLRPREDFFPTEAGLAEEIGRLLRLRTSHGYVLVR